jgi:hypothetical protein
MECPVTDSMAIDSIELSLEDVDAKRDLPK